ncbi:MAG: ABC-F family ATP-binding cassette domain-containing protein [Acidimicrobiales bacterium]
MITGRAVTIEIGGRTLVRDASFLVGPGDKVGLVGRNGTGKSSLVSLICGPPPPHLRTAGDIVVQGSIGFLPQVPAPGGLGLEATGLSHVLSARGLDRLDDELHAAQRALAEDPTEEVVAHFAETEERYRLAGGYTLEGDIARLADGLGLPQDALFNDIDGLSGGQRRRVDLVRVLFARPDTLVLDEPTNHLDLHAKRWLTAELERYPGALLVISHDIRLLDRTITKVLHLSDGTLREFTGNYTSFRAQLGADTERSEKKRSLEDREIRRLSTLADSMRASTAGRARKAKVLDRRVEGLKEDRTQVMKRERTVTFRLPVPSRAGAIPLTVRGIGVSYGTKKVLLHVDFVVGRGERVVVIGRNGAGKSSLLRCLAGVQRPSAGDVELGYNVAIGYFAQEHEQLDPDRRALEQIDDGVLRTVGERRALLGSFGLTGGVAEQLPASLSGGERAKLSLAMLSAGRSNLLVLDEPTNNLDPASVQAVGTMLGAWPGTVLAVSHDRPFVDALRPTHALHLPEERYDLWRDEYLEDVELR